MPTFRPPCIHEAHFRHRGASVSGFLRPSATVAAWYPGPAGPIRGGRRRLALAASRYLSRASLLLRAACVRSSPPGFTHARGNAAAFLPPLRQPAAARTRSRLSLSASGNAIPTQAGLLQTNIAAMSIGINRLPSSFALLGRGFTMPTVCANACHRPSIHRGSRLGFYRLRLLP